MPEEKLYSATDEGDCEVFGEDGRAHVGEGCMNQMGMIFSNLKFQMVARKMVI